MRLDRLTTKFQQALADAQSLAVGADNQFIEPVHVLAALLDQEDGGTASLALPGRGQRAEAPREPAQGDRPPAEGRGPRRRSPDRARPLEPPQPHRQGSAEARRPVHRLGALPACRGGRQGRGRPPAEGSGREQEGDRPGDQGGPRRRVRRQPRSRGAARGAQEVHARSHRARPPGQARSGHRPGRRDPARHPDPAAPHEEQPGADRRARRRQDRHRRGPRAADRRRRDPRNACAGSACSRSTWRRCSPGRSTAASSRSA